jgi:hypothetical protein
MRTQDKVGLILVSPLLIVLLTIFIYSASLVPWQVYCVLGVLLSGYVGMALIIGEDYK